MRYINNPSTAGKSLANQILREHFMDRIKNEDAVNHPKHYQGANGMEAIDVIEAFNLNFHLGNVVKYILRKDSKGDALQDLKKAKWYLGREIASISDPERGITKDSQASQVGIDPAAPGTDKTSFTLWDMIPDDAEGSVTIGWNKFHKDAVELAREHRGVFRDYDVIIGIARGGLVLAQILAYEWGIRDVRLIQVQAYHGRERYSNIKVPYVPSLMEGAEVLIVDSLADTGGTMRVAKSFIPAREENIKRMALYCKPDAMSEVDVYHTVIPQKIWVEFPWEREPKESAGDATSEASVE